MPTADQPLHQKIAAAIRRDIFHGKYRPGDRLPTVAQLAAEWQCSSMPVLKAYRELARQGLVDSRVSRGTMVLPTLPDQERLSLRKAMLLNQAEAHLLRLVNAGYTPDEVEQANRQAIEHWRAFNGPDAAGGVTLRFVGSHDPAITLIAAQAAAIHPGLALQVNFTGSLGGLIALAEQDADLAGCHLWDAETRSYNRPFVRRLFPGQRMALLTLAHRHIGLIVPPGNPQQIAQLADLARPGVTFVNRQPGSGTRVWLDAQLRRLGIDPQGIAGYPDERRTHSEVAASIARGQGSAGLGVQTAALAFGLDFILLTVERYELVMPEVVWHSAAAQDLQRWLLTEPARQALDGLGGYDLSETGRVEWVE
ncbi:MAG: substrate-binding domain-containing protein [Chloroflexota bacterium]